MSGKSRNKKHVARHLKFPNGASDLKKYAEKVTGHSVEEKVVQFVHNLAASSWESHCARPKSDVFGFYLICRWYPKDGSWVILYAGKGNVNTCLNQHFGGGHPKTPIGNYLSSFPKDSRSLLWLKWAKDPFYPYEGMSLDDVLLVLSQLYCSDNEKPPFNMDFDPAAEKIPDDFSIIPNWNKTKRPKVPKVAAKS